MAKKIVHVDIRG